MRAFQRQKLITPFTSKRPSKFELAGSVHMLVLGVLTMLFLSGGGYLYAVNQSAVQGYHMRTLEKEINALKQQSAELRITEADLRSLEHIESSSAELQMKKMENVKYVEERGPVALR